MRVLRFRYWAWVLLLSFRYTAGAQSSKGEYNFRPLDNKIKEWLTKGYYPGAAVIVVKDNKVLFKKYYGSFNAESTAHIASAGKWLAAAAIATVVDEGKLSWDDRVDKWLPQFKDVKGKATLRQLLSHTSGYPDYQPIGNHRDDYQTLAESVDHIVNLPADITPGSVFHYGGLAMQVAGRMAEIATGKDWETLFQERIARPLHMRNTHFTPVDTTGGHNPMLGGGAVAILDDYANFLSMISNNGVFHNKRVLSAKAVKELQANQVGNAKVNKGEYVEKARASIRKDVYGLGEWREEVDTQGKANLISSPSWAGAYPWVDYKNHIYGFFLARVNVEKANRDGFSAFFASPVLPILVRDILRKEPKDHTLHYSPAPQ